MAKNDWHEASVTVTLEAGTNDFVLQNSGAIQMTIDQIIYEPVGTPKEQYGITVRSADFGQVSADVDKALAGETVHLTITPEEGYGLKALNVVNSVYYTQGKTIPFEEDATEVSFVMPDNDVTIQPVFYDKAAIYELDYSEVANGALPVGWRTTDGSDVRDYPSQNGSGPRTFAGLSGYQGKALYWRTTSAEYGRLADYPLTLNPGRYQLVYAMAAWKGTPTYKARILVSGGRGPATSEAHTAAPNINGNSAGDISTAERHCLDFEVKTAGKYIIQFREEGSGMQEFLLAECRLRDLNNITGITNLHIAKRLPRGIYSPTGIRRQTLQHGLNIVVDADGNSKKVFIR